MDSKICGSDPKWNELGFFSSLVLLKQKQWTYWQNKSIFFNIADLVKLIHADLWKQQEKT